MLKSKARCSKLTGLPVGFTVAVINLYQHTFGIIVGGRCRFYPSCSEYAKSALKKHGFLRGAGLSARRLIRCHPWNPGGVDEP